MRLVVDFDGTITRKTVVNVSESLPNLDVIARLNELSMKGCHITIFTSRGMLSAGSKVEAEEKYRYIVEGLLKEWGVYYNELIFGKQSGDLYIDDLGMREIDFTKKNIYFFKMGRPLIIELEQFGILPGNYESLGQLQILSQMFNVFIPEDSIGDISKYSNVRYYKPNMHYKLIDYIFIDNGIMPEQNMTIERGIDSSLAKEQLRLLPIIDAPIIYSFTDPRLPWTNSLYNCHKIITLHQNSEDDLDNSIIRGHQEKLCLLNLHFSDDIDYFAEDYFIVARNKYDTNEKYVDFIRRLPETAIVNVYGNFEHYELGAGDNIIYHGVVKSNELHKVYCKHRTCIMTPVEYGWITQKLYEALHYVNDVELLDYDLKELSKIHFSKSLEAITMTKYYRTNTWVELYKDIFKKVDTIMENYNIQGEFI